VCRRGAAAHGEDGHSGRALPLPRRVSSDPGQVHPPGTVLDEEQHIQAAQQHRVDMEEVHRQDGLGLGVQERLPGLPGPPGRWGEARVLEDPPHGRWRHLTPPPHHQAAEQATREQVAEREDHPGMIPNLAGRRGEIG
jgi:hypothetical protein